jgi:hypothetical protein
MATLTYDQDVPWGTNRPGTQVLEITITAGGADTIATAVFPKPFRSAPRILSHLRGNDAVVNAKYIARISTLSTTGLVATFDSAQAGSEVYKIYVMGELAPS